MTPDSELLATFARTNSEDAFAELVKRHVNLVYSAAHRQVNGDEHFAKDVAQTVFTDLARKAGSLARRESLTGWLYTSAHFAAAKIIRTETRRRDREETFMRETVSDSGTGVSPVQSAPDLEWENLRPLLDTAMHELKEADREAILLRYFENRPFAEVGTRLGLNENAARMRVERALEKLRGVIIKRGITATATLSALISAKAVQLAPAGLAATVTTTSIAIAGTGTYTLLKMMTATQLKLTLGALVVAGTATAFVLQNQAQEKLRTDNAALTQKLAQLMAGNHSLSNQLTSASNSIKLPAAQFSELLKLRGEVGVLKQSEASRSNKLAQMENRLGLTDEQMPPVYSSSAPDTAAAYARLAKKQAEGNLTLAEEFNLLKAWPYLGKRFNEPDTFGDFQSQYLAHYLNITNQDVVWKLRRILENARGQEHAHGLRWARLSDQELKRYAELNLDMEDIRGQWNDLNQKITQQIIEPLTRQQQTVFTSFTWPVMDFDSRLKSTSQPSLEDSRYRNLTSQEIFDAYQPPNSNVRWVPGRVFTQ